MLTWKSLCVALFIQMLPFAAHAQGMSAQEFDAIAKEAICTSDIARASPNALDRFKARIQRAQYQTAQMGPCSGPEKRLSYRCHHHDTLHPHYQKAFAGWNCQCYTSYGQCRPTEFRQAKVGPDNDSGFEIMVNGKWYPIPKASLRREKAVMSPELLQWDAHVCSNDPNPLPHIECAWIDLPG